MIDENEIEGGTRGDRWDTIAVYVISLALIVGNVTVAFHFLGGYAWVMSLIA